MIQQEKLKTYLVELGYQGDFTVKNLKKECGRNLMYVFPPQLLEDRIHTKELRWRIMGRHKYAPLRKHAPYRSGICRFFMGDNQEEALMKFLISLKINHFSKYVDYGGFPCNKNGEIFSGEQFDLMKMQLEKYLEIREERI